MKELRAWMNKGVPKSGRVQAFADNQANEPYKQHEFVELSTRMSYFSVGTGLNLKRCISQIPGAFRVGSIRSGS